MNEFFHPLVSYCILTYNQQSYVEDAIKSALMQDYSPLEIIISDDCSTDATFEVIRKTIQQYSGPHRIVLNRNAQNMGLMKHYNFVFRELASGQWIVNAGGDDSSFPHRVSTLMSVLDKDTDVLAIGSSYYIIDANGEILSRSAPIEGIQVRSFLDHQKKFPILLHGATAMWNRNLFKKKILGATEDVTLEFRAMLHGKVLFVPDVLVKYRMHDKNLSGRIHVKDWRHKRYVPFRVAYSTMTDDAVRQLPVIENNVRCCKEEMLDLGCNNVPHTVKKNINYFLRWQYSMVYFSLPYLKKLDVICLYLAFGRIRQALLFLVLLFPRLYWATKLLYNNFRSIFCCR